MAQVMSYIEREGWVRGRAEGREEGRAEVLLVQLNQSFGPIDEATTARIQALKADALLELAKVVFALADQASLERWLTEHGV